MHFDPTITIGNLFAILLIGGPVVVFMSRLGPRIKSLEESRQKEQLALEGIQAAQVTTNIAIASIAACLKALASRLERMEGQVDQLWHPGMIERRKMENG